VLHELRDEVGDSAGRAEQDSLSAACNRLASERSERKNQMSSLLQGPAAVLGCTAINLSGIVPQNADAQVSEPDLKGGLDSDSGSRAPASAQWDIFLQAVPNQREHRGARRSISVLSVVLMPMLLDLARTTRTL